MSDMKSSSSSSKKSSKRRPRSADKLRRDVKLSVNIDDDQGDPNIIKASMSGVRLGLKTPHGKPAERRLSKVGDPSEFTKRDRFLADTSNTVYEDVIGQPKDNTSTENNDDNDYLEQAVGNKDNITSDQTATSTNLEGLKVVPKAQSNPDNIQTSNNSHSSDLNTIEEVSSLQQQQSPFSTKSSARSTEYLRDLKVVLAQPSPQPSWNLASPKPNWRSGGERKEEEISIKKIATPKYSKQHQEKLLEEQNFISDGEMDGPSANMLQRMQLSRILEMTSPMRSFQNNSSIRVACLRHGDLAQKAQLLTIKLPRQENKLSVDKAWKEFLRRGAIRCNLPPKIEEICVWNSELKAEVCDIESLRDGDTLLLSIRNALPPLKEKTSNSGDDEEIPENVNNPKTPVVQSLNFDTVEEENMTEVNDDKETKTSSTTTGAGNIEEGIELQKRAQMLRQLIDAIRHGRSLFGMKVGSARELFEAMDRNKTGYVSRKEFEAALRRLDATYTKGQIPELMRMLGKEKKDNKINYHEFLAILEECVGGKQNLPYAAQVDVQIESKNKSEAITNGKPLPHRHMFTEKAIVDTMKMAMRKMDIVKDNTELVEEEILRIINETPNDPHLLVYYAEWLQKSEDVRSSLSRSETYYLRALDNVESKATMNGVISANIAEEEDVQQSYEQEQRQKRYIDNSKAEVLRRLGLLASEEERYADAESYFTRAVLIVPNSANILYSFAEYLIRILEYDRAERCYLRGLVIDPNHFESLLGYAHLLAYYRKDYDLACSYFKRAIMQGEIQAGRVALGTSTASMGKRSRYGSGGTHRERGRSRLARALSSFASVIRSQYQNYDRAEKILNRALNICDPISKMKDKNALSNIYYEHALVHHDRAKLNDNQILQQQSQDLSKKSSFRSSRSRILNIDKEKEAEAEWYELAINSNPDHHKALLGLAVLLSSSKLPTDQRRATSLFEKALEAVPTNFVVRAKERHYVNKHSDSRPDMVNILFAFAKHLDFVRGFNEWSRADALYKRCIKLAPNDASIALTYAQFLDFRLNDTENAYSYYTEAMRLDEDSPEILVAMGQFLETNPEVDGENHFVQIDRAHELYAQALTIQGDNIQAVVSLANLKMRLVENDIALNHEKTNNQYWKNVEIESCKKLFEKAIEYGPENELALRSYAIFVHKIYNDATRATDFLKRAVQLNPDHVPTVTAYAILLLHNRHDYKKAERYLLSAVKVDPYNVEALHHLGMIFEDVHGDLDQAKTYYVYALEVDIEHVPTLMRLGGLLSNSRMQGARIHDRYDNANDGSVGNGEMQGRPWEAHIRSSPKSNEFETYGPRECLATAVALAPNNADAHFYYATYLADVCIPSRTQDAISHLLKAVDNDNYHVLSFYRLGCICVDEGLWADAEKYFLQAMEIEPQKAPCMQDVVFMLHQIRSDCSRIENSFIHEADNTQSEFFAKKLVLFQKLRKYATLKAMMNHSDNENQTEPNHSSKISRHSRDYLKCFQRVFQRQRR
eukprot:g1741.t1